MDHVAAENMDNPSVEGAETSKRDLSEADICDRYITPVITEAGWDPQNQIRREFSFTASRVTVRGERKRVDYLLFYQVSIPLAVVDVKDSNHAVGAGMQQAIGYAKAMDVPFVFSSDGDRFMFHDLTGFSQPVERFLSLNEFPSTEDLLGRYRSAKALTDDGDKPGLNLTQLRERVVPIPPLAEQCRIVAKVNELMAIIDHLAERLTATQETQAAFAAAVHHLDT